jgi:hypothetical protein
MDYRWTIAGSTQKLPQDLAIRLQDTNTNKEIVQSFLRVYRRTIKESKHTGVRVLISFLKHHMIGSSLEDKLIELHDAITNYRRICLDPKRGMKSKPAAALRKRINDEKTNLLQDLQKGKVMMEQMKTNLNAFIGDEVRLIRAARYAMTRAESQRIKNAAKDEARVRRVAYAINERLKKIKSLMGQVSTIYGSGLENVRKAIATETQESINMQKPGASFYWTLKAIDRMEERVESVIDQAERLIHEVKQEATADVFLRKIIVHVLLDGHKYTQTRKK